MSGSRRYDDSWYDLDDAQLPAYARASKQHVLEQGAWAFRAHYPFTGPMRDFRVVQVWALDAAYDDVFVHPRDLDRRERCYEWFAYWWCVGYVDAEEEEAREIVFTRQSGYFL